MDIGSVVMDQRRVTHIPFPGGSGETPTGAMQFLDDWPGLFIRGDDAIGLLIAIKQLLAHVGSSSDVSVASAVARLQGIAKIIERDVFIRAMPKEDRESLT
jgi:hypothetical protein